MSSTVIAKNIQVGTSGTATNNFNWYQPASPDGTVRLGVGNYGATTLDAITVNNSGNVGIGTSSPSVRLQVDAGSASEVQRYNTTSTTPFVGWYVGGTRKGYQQWDSAFGWILDSEAASTGIVFRTQNTERMQIASNGNITATGTLTTASRGISAASVPAGSVIQVVSNVVLSNFTGTSSTGVDFPAWSFTFTPQYATSKVFILISAGVNYICDGQTYLKRNGTIVKDTWFGSSRQDDQYDYPQAAAFYLDSPGTTSTITYQVGGRATGCSNIIRFGGSDNHASFTMMEIAA